MAGLGRRLQRRSGAGSSRAGFVVLLLVHEMGHVIALRREGIKASAPMFIPFLGAVISATSLGDNAARRGARRPRRPDPRQHRRCRLRRDLARHRQRLLAGARASPGSSSTCSTCCRSCRSTAGARWRRWPRGCGSPGSPGWSCWRSSFPNPIILLISCRRRPRDLPALEAAPAGGAEQAGLLPRQPARPGAGRRRLHRPDRAAGRRDGRRRTCRGRCDRRVSGPASPPRVHRRSHRRLPPHLRSARRSRSSRAISRHVALRIVSRLS